MKWRKIVNIIYCENKHFLKATFSHQDFIPFLLKYIVFWWQKKWLPNEKTLVMPKYNFNELPYAYFPYGIQKSCYIIYMSNIFTLYQL